MAVELGQAYVQIVPSAKGISGSITSAIGGEAESAGKKAGASIAGGIGTALKSATGIMAAGTAALTGTLVSGSSAVAEYGDNIDKMSQKMGISRQGYQEWEAVMQHSGTSMETMKSSMKTLANAVEKGNDSFERIGISVDDLANMSQEEIFAATIAGLQNVDNETERTYLAGQLLGRGATELGALLNTSAEDTQAMRDRVKELGGVMSDDAVKAAAAFQDNMQDLQTAISGLGRNMMSELMPSMNTIIAGFTSLVAGEEGASQKLQEGFSSLFGSLEGVAQNVISTITTMLPGAISTIASILPEIISMAGTLITSLGTSIISALPNLLTTVVPALLQSAIELITALGQALVDTAPMLIDAGVQLVETLLSSFGNADFLSNGLEIVQKLLDGITSGLPNFLAKGAELLTNLINGILSSLPSLITTATQLITTFIGFLAQNFPTILQTGATLLLNLVNGIVQNLPMIIDAVVKMIASFAEAVLTNLPTILEQGIIIIAQLVVGLIQAIPKIIAAIPQIIGSIVDAFKEFDWLNIGTSILEGIASGLANGVGIIIDAAKEAALSAFNAAKNALNINSPSKKGMYIGQMLDEGFALGINKNSGAVEDAMSKLSDNATARFNANGSFEFNNVNSDERLDVLLTMLDNYLPVIAEKEGINVQELYNGFNRQLGAALT